MRKFRELAEDIVRRFGRLDILIVRGQRLTLDVISLGRLGPVRAFTHRCVFPLGGHRGCRLEKSFQKIRARIKKRFTLRRVVRCSRLNRFCVPAQAPVCKSGRRGIPVIGVTGALPSFCSLCQGREGGRPSAQS
jgi:hypothetical protein